MAKAKKSDDKDKSPVYVQNRDAYREYEILDTFEAGVALLGSEVKSIRQGKVSIKEAYAKIDGGEVKIVNMSVSPYSHASVTAHEEKRTRKLLLHKREIKKLVTKVSQRGFTLVPLKLYFNARGFVKIQIGLAIGKKLWDKRETIKRRDLDRDHKRAMKYR
ncbi:MAG: SsrA-binding protein SmpB [Planctomycetes bacterium]|nr:SsrA-binding protein SmpB [Planctomycetota bacterium]